SLFCFKRQTWRRYCGTWEEIRTSPEPERAEMTSAVKMPCSSPAMKGTVTLGSSGDSAVQRYPQLLKKNKLLRNSFFHMQLFPGKSGRFCGWVFGNHFLVINLCSRFFLRPFKEFARLEQVLSKELLCFSK